MSITFNFSKAQTMTEAALKLYLPFECTLTFISVNYNVIRKTIHSRMFIKYEVLYVNKFHLKCKNKSAANVRI